MNDDRPFWRSWSVLVSLVALVIVVIADAVLRHTGGKAADFTLFVGRFHPLVVHLPIGFVLLVGAAEAATLSPRLRPRVEPTIALVLPLLVAATVTAFLLGQLLARSGDFAPGALGLHRRLELFASVGICLFPLAWAYQEKASSERARWIYRGLLGCALGSLSIGAHFGGTLTRGDTYLTRYAPGPFKRLLGAAPAPLASASAAVKAKPLEPRLFADVIEPILDERCVQCHGEEKVKGGLRLDSLAGIMKGGEDGTVITPGNPSDSPLLARVLLPSDDDDHMPPEGKPGLTAPEIAALRFWIERGASDTLLVRDLLAPEDARTLLERALGAAPKPKTPTSVASAAPAAGPASARFVPPASDSASVRPASSAPAATPVRPASSAPAAAPVHPAPSAPLTAPARAPTGSSAGSPEHGSPATGSLTSSSATAILANRCGKCHGPDKQKGKLRVDSLGGLLAGGKSGPAIVRGAPGASTLVKRIELGLGEDKHMPPSKEPQLSAREVAVITAWIAGLAPSSGVEPAAAVTPKSLPQARPVEPVNATTTVASGANETGRSNAPPAADASAVSASDARGRSQSPKPASPEVLGTLPSRLALYPSEIAPLLHARCAPCHGGKDPAGGLSMGTYSALLKGGDSGPALAPGKPEASLLVRRVELPADDDDHMPPTRAPQLTPSEIALIEAWVRYDGSADAEIALDTLPGPAVEAIALHPPSRSRTDVGSLTPHPRSGGCGACALGERNGARASALFLNLAVIGGLSARRRWRPTRSSFRSR
jgi:mono/diheme cytochrome c family protein